MVVSMKMTALWDVVWCGLVEVDCGFSGVYCLHHQGDEEAACKKSDRNVGMVRPGEILSRPMGKGGDGQMRKETLPHTLSSLAHHLLSPFGLVKI
jgi:hypothetical protein